MEIFILSVVLYTDMKVEIPRNQHDSLNHVSERFFLVPFPCCQQFQAPKICIRKQKAKAWNPP